MIMSDQPVEADIVTLRKELEKALSRANKAQEDLSSMTNAVKLLSHQLRQNHTSENEPEEASGEERVCERCLNSDAHSSDGLARDIRISELNRGLATEQVSAMMDLQNSVRMLNDRNLLIAKDAEQSTADTVAAQHKYVELKRLMRQREHVYKLASNENAELRVNVDRLLSEKRILVREVRSLQAENKRISSRRLEDFVAGSLASHENHLRQSASMVMVDNPLERKGVEHTEDKQKCRENAEDHNKVNPNEAHRISSIAQDEKRKSSEGLSKPESDTDIFQSAEVIEKSETNLQATKDSLGSTVPETAALTNDDESRTSTNSEEWIEPIALRARLPTDFSIRCEGESLMSGLDSPTLTPAARFAESSCDFAKFSGEQQVLSSISIPM